MDIRGYQPTNQPTQQAVRGGRGVDCEGKKFSRSLVCYRLMIRIIGIQR